MTVLAIVKLAPLLEYHVTRLIVMSIGSKQVDIVFLRLCVLMNLD